MARIVPAVRGMYIALTLHLLWTLGAAAVITRRQRIPASAAAWLALVFLLPVAGTLLYVLAGYRRAYAERGLAPDPALIRELPVTASDCGALLDQLHAEGVRFSAVFAFSDMLAWSLWADLQARGLRVPEDCSIVGFDHIQSRMQFPFPLTTISSYKGRMSVTSVDVLISLMREEGAAPQQIVIDTKLVEGSTVRRLEQG